MVKLALHGGIPVRSAPLPNNRLGGSLIGEEELRELTEVIAAKSPFRHYGIGDPVKAATFEKETREALKVKYSLALSSGTAALACAMAALEIGPGDEVILPAFGWHSDYNCIVLAGALPVFAGIDDTLNLDPVDLERKITEKTKAVIVVHYQGGSSRLNEIVEIARKHGIKVVEDCAQAFGGQYDGKYLGTLGDIGLASFQYNKMITCGEGGLLYTNNEQYFARAVRYHDLGLMRPYFLDQMEDQSLGDSSLMFPGNQYRISELQAAVILAQFRKLPALLDKCRGYYDYLVEQLSNLHFTFRTTFPGHCGITLFMRFGSEEETNAFTKALTAEGIACGPTSSCTNMMNLPMVRNKTMPFHDMPPFGSGFEGEHIAYEEDRVSDQVNDLLSKHTSIAIGVQYSQEDIDDIVKAVRKVDAALYS